MDYEYKKRANKVKKTFSLFFSLIFGRILAVVFVVALFFAMLFAPGLYNVFVEKVPYGNILFWVLVVVIIAILILIYIYVPPFIKNLFSKNKNNKSIKSEKKPKESKKERSVENYQPKELLTETENKFYQSLVNELKGYDAVVMTKVRLEDLAKVWAVTREDFNRARGYIKSRHVDFVVCNKEMSVKCGIEVDDASHETPEAKEIDEFKDNLFKKLGLELYRIVDMNKLEEGAKIVVSDMAQRGLITKESENKEPENEIVKITSKK